MPTFTSKRKMFKRVLLASVALLASSANLSAQAPIVSQSSVKQASLPAEANRYSNQYHYYDSSYEPASETNVLSTPSVISTSAESPVQSTGYFNSASSTCCDSVGCEPVCCLPWWAHRNGAFGEFLLLSAGNSDIMYAREETDPLLQGTPTGPTGILQDTASAGFRVGVNIARDNCSSIFGAFTQWEGGSSSSITANGANILNPVLLHPSLLTTGSTAVSAIANQYIRFRFADMGYRRVYSSGTNHVINWSTGLRYGKLEQKLNTSQTVSVATGLTNMITGVDYDGFGLLAGLDAERQSQETGLLVYGKVGASMMAGNWRARSRQTNQFGGGVAANNYRDFRLSPILESELGAGWQSESGGLRLTAGFLASGWFNAISTRDYIQSFNEGNFVDMNDTVTFSGLTAKIELRH
jgi:Legionella pneumophila major outer membrane protein precursor